MAAKSKVRTSDVYLIVDTRERKVIPFIEDSLGRAPGAAPLNLAHVVGQVNTGDYLICRRGKPGGQPRVLAVIERKTYVDFAASFKDGRYQNLDKMLAMRAATGCQLYYFIEGPAFPAPGRRFARIPYANIKSAIVKLQVESGVFIVQTEDEQHTATSLAEFMRAYDASDVASRSRAAAAAIEGGATPAAFAPAAAFAPFVPTAETKYDLDAELDPELEAPVEAPFEPTVPSALTALVEVSEGDAATAAWSGLRGISVVLGKILTREFPIVKLAVRQVGEARIRALKTATGRAINKDAVASLLAIHNGSDEHAVKLLSGLRNITPVTAATILQSVGGLKNLCSTSSAALAAVSLKQKTRTVKLGKAKADRILSILRYCEGKAAGEAPAPQSQSNLASLSRLVISPPASRTTKNKAPVASLDDVFDDAADDAAPQPDILAGMSEADLAGLFEE